MKKEQGIKIIMIIAIILVIAGIAFVGYGIFQKLTKKLPNPVATIEVQDYGTIKVELYPDQAPNTVTNFITLANRGFYNGLTFHRTIPGFMIQGGDPTGTGQGGSRMNIKGEFSSNGVENNISHTRGVISMARNSYNYNSASSQFFIVHQDSTYLDGEYAAFGHVTKGMEVVDEIVKNTKVESDGESVSKENQPVIEKIRLKENDE